MKSAARPSRPAQDKVGDRIGAGTEAVDECASHFGEIAAAAAPLRRQSAQ